MELGLALLVIMALLGAASIAGALLARRSVRRPSQVLRANTRDRALNRVERFAAPRADEGRSDGDVAA